MTRNRGHRSLNMPNQGHEGVNVVVAEAGARVIGKPKETFNREVPRVGDANGGATLVPTALPDPIFGYPATDE